jgi:predicted RNase H-like nuclease (RuvC/YqgF family)
VEGISAVGTPIIVAGDKTRPSELVRRINASFAARIFSPKKELGAEFKRQIGKGALIRNPHERDAYAAALAAYNSYSNKFKQVEGMASASIDIDAVKRSVVLKRSMYEAVTGKRPNRA